MLFKCTHSNEFLGFRGIKDVSNFGKDGNIESRKRGGHRKHDIVRDNRTTWREERQKRSF